MDIDRIIQLVEKFIRNNKALIGMIPIFAIAFAPMIGSFLADPTTLEGVKFNVPKGFESPSRGALTPDERGSIDLKHEGNKSQRIKIEVLVGDHSYDSVKKRYSRNATEYVKQVYREDLEKIEISGITFYKREWKVAGETCYIFTYNNQIFQITFDETFIENPQEKLNHESLLKEILDI